MKIVRRESPTQKAARRLVDELAVLRMALNRIPSTRKENERTATLLRRLRREVAKRVMKLKRMPPSGWRDKLLRLISRVDRELARSEMLCREVAQGATQFRWH